MQLSALSIPSREGELAQAVDEAWAAIEPLPAAPGVLAYALEQVPGLKKLAGLAASVGIDAVESAMEARRTGTQDGDPEDLRTPEWRVFVSPGDAPETDDFKLRSVATPRGYADQLADVVLVERLREVSALTGFTRSSARTGR